MSQTSQVYAHLNEPTEKPEAARVSLKLCLSDNVIASPCDQPDSYA